MFPSLTGKLTLISSAELKDLVLLPKREIATLSTDLNTMTATSSGPTEPCHPKSNSNSQTLSPSTFSNYKLKEPTGFLDTIIRISISISKTKRKTTNSITFSLISFTKSTRSGMLLLKLMSLHQR